jgi:hypothetical protein
MHATGTASSLTRTALAVCRTSVGELTVLPASCKLHLPAGLTDPQLRRPANRKQHRPGDRHRADRSGPLATCSQCRRRGVAGNEAGRQLRIPVMGQEIQEVRGQGRRLRSRKDKTYGFWAVKNLAHALSRGRDIVDGKRRDLRVARAELSHRGIADRVRRPVHELEQVWSAVFSAARKGDFISSRRRAVAFVRLSGLEPRNVMSKALRVPEPAWRPTAALPG